MNFGTNVQIGEKRRPERVKTFKYTGVHGRVLNVSGVFRGWKMENGEASRVFVVQKSWQHTPDAKGYINSLLKRNKRTQFGKLPSERKLVNFDLYNEQQFSLHFFV